MQPQHNICSEPALEGKRPRLSISEPEDLMSNPKKRQNKGFSDEENPYDAIPQLPHIQLTYEEMNSDPIQIFIKLEQKYGDYGAVKVSACDKWNCPHIERCADFGITTRHQILSKLKLGKAFEQNVQSHNFRSYQQYAKEFENKYQYKTKPKGKTIQSKKQSEYWSLVTRPEYEKSTVKVEYAADLPSIKYGSGFPNNDKKYNDKNFAYDTNLFNLNNIMNSPCSVLSMATERKQKVSGITHPWVYMASLFSSFCWHVEDLCVNSLNYNHKGGIKCWYVVPGACKQKFNTYVKSKYCVNNHKQTLLDRITFMVDPIELINAGIPVYKTYQRPHDFVCTFFSSYHCGFSLGYNIGEAVNFLSPLSLQIMKEQIKIKKLNPKSSPCVIPIQWIIYQNYLRLNKQTKYGEIIEEAYHEMIELERKQLQQFKKLQKLYTVSKVIVQPGSKKYDKIYCSKCKEYLYLHAYKTTDKKIYCFEDLKQEEKAECILEILVREPNNDRKYILKMFGQIPIDQNIGKEKKRKSSEVPAQTKKYD